MASSPSPSTSPQPGNTTATPPPASATPPSTTSPSVPTAAPPVSVAPPPQQVISPPPQPSAKPPQTSPSTPPPPPPTTPSPQPPSSSPSPPSRPPEAAPPPPPENSTSPLPSPPPPGPPSPSDRSGNTSVPPVAGPPRSSSPPVAPPRASPSIPSVPLSPPPPPGVTPPGSRHHDTPSGKPRGPDTSKRQPGASETSKTSDSGGIGTGGLLAIVVVAGIIALCVVGLAFWILHNRRTRRRRKRHDFAGDYYMPSPYGSAEKSDLAHSKAQSSAPVVGSQPASSDFIISSSDSGGSRKSGPWFQYEELYNATNGFSAQNLLGEGGFGPVYKGYLPDGRVVAVKQLKVGGGQGEREFRAEIEIISRVHHRHLVSLVGYCIFQTQRLLVYDYVPNNTLYFHLHGEGRPVLNWATRVKIAAGAARGIAYLHEDCHPRIIHRDIKSSNILLDDNFEARVSDFGLAKLFFDANTHVTTRVMGTFGYMAPEYASSGKLTEKSDVYSFGVVLLELITGRKPVDASQPVGDESLVEWARPLLGHALETEDPQDLVDPRLEKNYVKSEVLRMIEASAACVRHSAAKRPTMGQVVRTFDTMSAADLSNGMRPGESEIYNRQPQSVLVRLFQRMAHGDQPNSSSFFSEGSLNTRESQ